MPSVITTRLFRKGTLYMSHHVEIIFMRVPGACPHEDKLPEGVCRISSSSPNFLCPHETLLCPHEDKAVRIKRNVQVNDSPIGKSNPHSTFQFSGMWNGHRIHSKFHIPTRSERGVAQHLEVIPNSNAIQKKTLIHIPNSKFPECGMGSFQISHSNAF